jgi:hypothetical protein
LRAGGNSSVVWALDDTLRAMDRGISVPVLGELAKRHVAAGAPVDFEALLRELGVVVTRPGRGARPGSKATVRLDDTAPLAAVRQAIVRGKP